MTRRIVIALGGNAIQESGKPATSGTQLDACRKTAVRIVDIIESGCEVVVAHGNGPQVGNIVLQNESADSDKTPAMPFDVCGAMSQGEIGYWLQQSIGDELKARGKNIPVCTIVTQVIVSKDDGAFKNPTKPIGPFYTEEAAKKIANDKGYVMKEDAGRGWRRVVASPVPVDVVEKEAIKKLVEGGILTIAVGGGGIPVIDEGGALKGVAAVIDKDFGSETLAEILDADVLLILTAVEKISINYNKPEQKDISAMTVADAEKYMAEGQFAPGSMLPKVKAGIKFVTSKKGRICIVTSLESADRALKGETGTIIR